MTTEHILIIDDSMAIASLLANEILPLGGYRATAALSGEEGLEIARELHPNLILCDLEMPGISGLDVLRSLYEEGIDSPSIIMTAFGSEAKAAQALRMGVKGYIIKPFTTEEMLAAIERALVESRLKIKLDLSDSILEDYRQTMLILQAVSQASAGDLSPSAVLSRIVLAAVYGSGAKAGYIAGYNPSENKITIQSVVNLPGWHGKVFSPKSRTALSETLLKNKPTQEIEAGRCWFHIPLLRQNKAIGVFSIVYPQENMPRHIKQLYSALAGYASFALENNQLRCALASDVRQGELWND
ncbi:MAG: response regulator [Anaerolineales bacterium]|nr:response regulator [Anaerolineales bacterium]